MHIIETTCDPDGMYAVSDAEATGIGKRSLFLSAQIYEKYKFLIEEYSCDILSIGPSYRGFVFGLDLASVPRRDQLVALNPAASGQAMKVDWSAIRAFPRLASLHIDRLNPFFDADFSTIPLTNLEIEYDERNHTWTRSARLRSLWISDFQADDLTPLQHLTSLEALHLIKPRITSLQGIEKLRNLQILSMSHARRLSSVRELRASGSLSRINAEGNPEELDWSVLAGMPQLEALSIDVAADVRFVAKLPRLRHLSIWKKMPAEQRKFYKRISDEIVFHREPIEDGRIFSLKFRCGCPLPGWH